MLKGIEAFGDRLAFVTSVASRLMLLAVVTMLFVQVCLRYIFNFSLTWPEEASRYLMIWVVMLSGSLLVKDEQLVCVDFFDRFWPRRILAYRNALFRLLLAGLLGIMLWKGLDAADFGWRRTSPALHLSWFWIYLAIPVGSALMLFHMVVLALRDLVRGASSDQEISLIRAEM
ncbi:TRAP transporter small permease [Rhodobium gokarnense]|uniref:TRAP transporter small permease protein n=1 Tax=Rhodobium gokarnense TaxID=364296 RepID=A0ABT3HDW0_9HYPH|nr:TRAP transporter small permease [Rhodobium gokarnense]MCW2308509.1 TRAP-type C4-dicarboxylate transport system permease small subunit [Rhodobium gokarnense]